MGNTVGILFEDKHCAVHLFLEDNLSDAHEWWWEERESETIFIVAWCPINYPALTVHRMVQVEAQEQLDKLLSEGWIVKSRHNPIMLKVPSIEIEQP